ncbi:exodeoxyribonuclease VII large subunit [Pollutibacter soli]|uniref:exodeoxyribonuclease VII large subunit n=1 Tax=Pollutibacter soli TaxID=3034157 RepID=UPI003013B0B2
MADQSQERKIFTLLDVSKSIQQTLAGRYGSAFWVKAEMNKLNYYPHSGHCYPELVEKSGGKITAQMKANLWKDDYLRADQKFRATLKEPLKDGIKILFLAKISFNPVHGLALQILEIDPAFTLGDLEKEKQESIDRLKQEGVFSLNKFIPLALLPQRIAIISVESSKGYADFIDVISKNPWKYRFFHMLFPAVLQGDKAAAEITAQLNRIRKVIAHFDVVAIIRGGGGDIGLSCYNNYTLAQTICTFPAPVITGIGHSTNETVAELVSFQNAITPTKLAEYLIQQFHDFSVPVQEAEARIIEFAESIIAENKYALLSTVKLFRSVTENILLRNKNFADQIGTAVQKQISFRFHHERARLNNLKFSLTRSSAEAIGAGRMNLKNSGRILQKDSVMSIKAKKQEVEQFADQLRQQVSQQISYSLLRIDSIEKNVRNLSPENVLRRGYSITRSKGKLVRNAEDVNPGDHLSTTLYSGNVTSIAESIEKLKKDE